MANPGFSVSDLIEAVDWTITFIIELKQVPAQVHDFLKNLQTSRSQLQGLEKMLLKNHHNVNHRTAELISLQKELYKVLGDSETLLKRFQPDAASNSGRLSNLRHNLRWVVDS